MSRWRAVPIAGGGQLLLSSASPLAHCARAARHAGYRLRHDRRGRLVAVPLNNLTP